MEQEPLKILIAEDNETDRMILQRIIFRLGHTVISARDGVEAIELYERELPQIVLLDVLMPRMDGLMAARRLKELAGEDLVPIIFLTSLSDAESLAQCLDAGGDDFLSKPYNPVVLKAKIQAFNRMRVMHRTLLHQRNQISLHHEHMVREQQVAKTVFDNIANLGCLQAHNLRYFLSPVAVFNGDVLLAAMKPSGGMHVLLGDFTGHGLPAAIGAMPLAEIFYGMTAKGFAMTDVLREINQKLKKILPPGFFCCAAMVDLNFSRREIEVWMGGMPACFLLHRGELTSLPSNHLPLGVLETKAFSAKTYKFEVNEGDRIFLWSDGIVEACSPEGELFGEKRLRQVFVDTSNPEALFDEVHQRVLKFIGGAERSDDLSMVEVAMMPEHALGIEADQMSSSALKGPESWEFTYKVEGQTLREFNPVPLILHNILEMPRIRAYSGQIYTVLTELYSNALEHGILGLRSEQKQTPGGFLAYYQERERRLKEMTCGWILFRIRHRMQDGGGVLLIRLEDSGPGFDYHAFVRTLPINRSYSGHGIPLLCGICRRLEYFGCGNVVEAEFVWGTPEGRLSKQRPESKPDRAK